MTQSKASDSGLLGSSRANSFVTMDLMNVSTAPTRSVGVTTGATGVSVSGAMLTGATVLGADVPAIGVVVVTGVGVVVVVMELW